MATEDGYTDADAEPLNNIAIAIQGRSSGVRKSGLSLGVDISSDALTVSFGEAGGMVV